MQRPLGQQRRAADDQRVAVDDALDAEALAVGEAPPPRQRPRLRRPSRSPARSGARTRSRAHRRAAAPRRDRLLGDRPRPALIRPVVTVPVLSSTTVSTRRVDSSTSGPLMSRPSCAPRPVPTISAIGVASPSAHGQAMISTATAAVNANDALSPAPSQKPSVASASVITTGTNTPETRSARRWTGALPVWASSTSLGDLGQRRVGADLRRPHDQPPAGVDGRTRDLGSGLDLDRHGLAGEHAHVDGRDALLDDAVGGDLLARADDEPVADGELLDRHAPLGAVGVEHRHVLRAELQQRLQGGAGAALRAGLEVAARRAGTWSRCRRSRGRSGRRPRRAWG